MNRLAALILAVFVETLTVSSACIAAPGELIRSELALSRGACAAIHAPATAHHIAASSGFMPSELIGLDLSGFRRSGTRPLRFAIA